MNTKPSGPNGKQTQSLDSAWSEAQGWFGTAFGNYKGKVNVIPGDTHSLVAMYAPRGLLVLDNSRIGELGSSAQHGASAAGALVHKALGVAEALTNAIRAHHTRTAAPAGKIEPRPAGTAKLTHWIDWEAPVLQSRQRATRARGSSP